jgi:hypothetical protein
MSSDDLMPSGGKGSEAAQATLVSGLAQAS